MRISKSVCSVLTMLAIVCGMLVYPPQQTAKAFYGGDCIFITETDVVPGYMSCATVIYGVVSDDLGAAGQTVTIEIYQGNNQGTVVATVNPDDDGTFQVEIPYSPSNCADQLWIRASFTSWSSVYCENSIIYPCASYCN